MCGWPQQHWRNLGDKLLRTPPTTLQGHASWFTKSKSLPQGLCRQLRVCELPPRHCSELTQTHRAQQAPAHTLRSQAAPVRPAGEAGETLALPPRFSPGTGTSG